MLGINRIGKHLGADISGVVMHRTTIRGSAPF